MLTSSTGTVEGTFTYGAYGNLGNSTGTATTPLGYDGQYTNSDTGLIYLRAREYDPSGTQFISVDPLAAVTDAPYTYAGDDPVDYVDPTGLQTFALPAPAVGACAAAPEACAAAAGAAVLGGADVWLGIKVVNAWAGSEGGDEGEAALHEKEAEREAQDGCPPSEAGTPTGRIGEPMDVPEGSNAAAEIDGLSYGGHALDEMQSEGITPTVVRDAIENGEKSVGESGRIGYYSPDNNVTVIVEDGRVVTVSSGSLNVR